MKKVLITVEMTAEVPDDVDETSITLGLDMEKVRIQTMEGPSAYKEGKITSYETVDVINLSDEEEI